MTWQDIKTLWFIFNLVKCVVYPHLTLGIIHNVARFEGLVMKELQDSSSVYWMEISQSTFSLLHANHGQNYTIPEPSLRRCAILCESVPTPHQGPVTFASWEWGQALARKAKFDFPCLFSLLLNKFYSKDLQQQHYTWDDQLLLLL